MIPYTIIGTGSDGNAVIVNKHVLVDCGLPYSKIRPYLDDIQLVLLTHIHQDHFKPSTIRRIALEKPLIRFGCGYWLVKPLVEAGVSATQIDVLNAKALYTYAVGNVLPVELLHDVPNFGYKLFFPEGKVFYATDCGTLAGIRAKGYSLYLVESNYEEEEIKVRMDEKRARGEYVYEQRSLKYHLSKQQCDNFLYQNMDQNSEYVYLHCHVDREAERERPDS